MKKTLLFLVAFFILAGGAQAQNSTTVTINVTDAGGQAWANGSFTALFVGDRNATWPGGNLTRSFTGSLSAAGSATQSLPNNNTITPSPSFWSISVCPNPAVTVTTGCFIQQFTITGASQTVTMTPPAIIISVPTTPTQINPVVAYADGEISGGWVGFIYYNVTIVGTRQCTAVGANGCTTWGAGGGVSPNSPLPASSSGPGPVFNVKNYGAKGNTRTSSNCTAAATNLNCTDVTFTTADVGDRVSCASVFSTIVPSTVTFTAFVNATNMTMSASSNGSGICTFGSADDAAVTAAQTAMLAQMTSKPSSGNLAVTSFAPTLYFPAGDYFLFNTGINIVASNLSGAAVMGDGIDQTKIYWGTGSTNAQGAALTCSNIQNFLLENLSLDGAQGQDVFSNGAIFTNCNTDARNVRVQRFSARGWVTGTNLHAHNIQVVGNSPSGLLIAGPAEVYESLVSNNFGHNLDVQNVSGMPFAPGVKWYSGIMDEGSPTASVFNSSGVWFIGASAFGQITIDGNSSVHFSGGEIGPFSTDPNVTALSIATGGQVQSSDVRYISSGTGKCINNSGAFLDNGNNSCESIFLIASGTSTGTTAVLTLTPAGANVNTNCTVGDGLIVTGTNIAGYDGYFPPNGTIPGTTTGITAVTATTLTYTTVGSNLGALGAVGMASCRNLQTYTGNLPRAELNNPIPNTCYVTITPIVNATTYTLCNFRTQSATNITSIKASSQTTTTCATAPIITISDGTATQTLTLTSAKNSWDSSVDTSTGVGTTIFKPNGTITVKYDVAAASACATPATNLAISYNISPILSN